MESFPYLISTKKLKEEFVHFQKISVVHDEFTIGRGQDNHICISYISLSRKHCKFVKHDDKWSIEDLSSFGIKVNGNKLTKGRAHILSPDDIIQLDVSAEFVYKFVVPEEEGPPKKMRKIEEVSPDSILKKFEESQNCEIELMETKIQSTQQLQNVSMERKKWLDMELERNVQQLRDEYAMQIDNLNGEKKEIEEQKRQLEQQRDDQIASMKQEMERKLNELMDEIKQHHVKEASLLRENSILKERLMRERDEFFLRLNKESSSKQDMLTELEEKIRIQEKLRIDEKQQLENVLRQETEQLRIAKEKELKDLEEQKKMREAEFEIALENMKELLEKQITMTKVTQKEAEQQLHQKTEEMNKIKEEDKTKMEELNKAREEAERKLAEAQIRAIKSEEELQKKMSQREIELASLAADRIQLQAEQSNQVIYNLQTQLESMRAQLQSLEQKNDTVVVAEYIIKEGESSKESALAEVGEIMESELQCSICAELLVHPITLGCSHTFCRYCISRWRQKSNNCPNCRVPIKSDAKSLVLETFIDKMVKSLSDEMKRKREEMLKDREELEAELARGDDNRGRSGNEQSTDFQEYRSGDVGLFELQSPRSSSSSVYEIEEQSSDTITFGGSDLDVADSEEAWPLSEANTENSLDSNDIGRVDFPSFEEDEVGEDLGDDEVDEELEDEGGEDLEDDEAGEYLEDEEVIEEEEENYEEGLPGAYYGGYGRCFRCGGRGHWAPGCPN